MLYSAAVLLTINLLDGFVILKRGTLIAPNQYPLWVLYLIQCAIFLVYFLFAGKVYQEIRDKKNIYLKLASWCFSLVVVTYILFYILKLITFKYFPQWDPNIIAYKSLGAEYTGPQFRPVSDLLTAPFEILYHGSPSFLQTFLNFLHQGLILSLLIPGLILLLKKIKF